MRDIERSLRRSGRRTRPARWHSIIALLLCVPPLVAAQPTAQPANVLPETAVARLSASVDAARVHRRHTWRDTPPIDDDLVNAYIEIPRGERTKYEFAMKDNDRAVDRIIPEDVGGYPVNYGFVPQTISWDGDPFDVLVLGPPLPGGRVVRGRIVGLMLMEDEKGIDSKVVVSLVDGAGRATHTLTGEDRDRIGKYFDTYKRHEPGGFSSVPGWGSPEDGLAHIRMTHAFFRQCRERAGQPCRVEDDVRRP